MKWLLFWILFVANGFSLSLEEKVGQLFLVYFEGEAANDNAKRLIDEGKVGGFVLYNWANRLEDPEEIRSLCSDLQSLSPIPLFLAIDQEGGRVARLKKGFTEFPGNDALGKVGDPLFAYQAAEIMGREMGGVGMNLNLAPVVDLQGTCMGDRSFSKDPDQVTELGRASLLGYQSSKVIPCLKHFPGHGSADVDPHRALPVVMKSFSEVMASDLVPYMALAKEAPMIMTAHVLFPNIDPDHCATLSPIFLQDILRKKLGFQGVLLTDSLSMQGVLEGHESLKEVAIRALEAGNDILLIGGRSLQSKERQEASFEEILHVFQCVVDAVRKGRLSEERIDQSVERILELKKRVMKDPERHPLRAEESLNLAREIAYRSLLVEEGLSDEIALFEIPLSEQEEIGKKIWKNECNGRVDQLTFWNEKEPFPSIGIGHFIWPPASYEGPFQDGRFHKFIEYAKKEGSQIPAWLIDRRHCPWETREAFYHDFQGDKLEELRAFLSDHVGLQARYMVYRLNQAFQEITLTAPVDKRSDILHNFFSVAKSPHGLYILIDYLNFKHEGTSEKERYNGQGWGLFQVLAETDPEKMKTSPAEAFAETAKRVLARRVANSPNQAIEKTWIPNWFSRLDSYVR